MHWKRLQIFAWPLLLFCAAVAGFSPTSPSIRRMDIGAPLPSIILFSGVDNEAQEKVWRYTKKPLLSIGSKGATSSHGNSLRQLLEDHTAVKVKVNTKPFDGSLEKAYESLRDLAIEKGAPEDIEMIQMRDNDRTILFGLPGTLEKMKEGTFPPPPPPPKDEEDEAETE